jgi:23S rRNA pseudouridine2605 synthase
VIAYHKPEGELVTRRDPEGRATVFERLPPLAHGRWIAVGRLDLNSSGLLLFTDSGELANRLMHPRHGIERLYLARVLGELSEAAKRQLLDGVQLDDGERARFESLEATGKQAGANRWYRVALREGRNREVRRLFEAVGCRVSRLRRIRFGPVELPRELAPGRWIELSAPEVRALE